MFVRIALACLLAVVPLAAQQEQSQQPELPKVPKDSVFVVVEGCLKGRVLRAFDVRRPDTTTGPVVRNKAFRLAGKKELMKQVKENDGSRVQVAGIIKKSALLEPGMKFKGGRIAIGGGMHGTSPSTALPDPAENVVVMDVTDVQVAAGKCGS
jgi:hypothetical protein